MAILILLNQVDPTKLETHLKTYADCPEVRICPDCGNKDDIECGIVW